MQQMLAVRLTCAAFLLTCSGAVEANSIVKAVVSSSERPSLYWGILSPYATVTVVYGKGKAITLFVPNFTEDQFLPSEGDICDVALKKMTISAMLRHTSLELEKAPVVVWMRCTSGHWPANLAPGARSTLSKK